MAIASINPTEKKVKPSALANAASVLGIVTDIGGLGLRAFDAFKPPAPKSPQELFWEHLMKKNGIKEVD